jgi:hypothetical protein
VLAAAVFFPTCGYPQDYPDCGSAPSADDQIGEKEYSPCLNIGYPQIV